MSGDHIPRILASIDRLRADMMEGLDRLQNAVALLRDEVAVSFHSSERMEGIARGASSETRALAAQVTAMERQILNLNTRVAELENRG